MWQFAFLGLLPLLAACEDRRNFDERYNHTANELEQRATNLDAELNKSVSKNDEAVER